MRRSMVGRADRVPAGVDVSASAAVFVSAAASAGAAVLGLRPAAYHRAHRVLGSVRPRKRAITPVRVVQMCCVVGGVVIIGGIAGTVAGVAAAAVAPSVMTRFERRAEADRRGLLARQVPLVCDLLAVALAAGRAHRVAVAEVAGAIGGPAATQLAIVADRMALSANSHDAWEGIDTELSDIGRAIRRSERSGTPVAHVLARTADEHRRSARADTQHQIQRISVRTAVPLGICFLPAFFLVGVCPVLIGSVARILP